MPTQVVIDVSNFQSPSATAAHLSIPISLLAHEMEIVHLPIDIFPFVRDLDGRLLDGRLKGVFAMAFRIVIWASVICITPFSSGNSNSPASRSS